MKTNGALEGKGLTVLITGASAGIGAAIAREFAKHGWDLALVARRLDRLQALAAELETAYGISARALECDLAAPDAVPNLVSRLRAGGFVIDGLVNNAGYAVPGVYSRTIWEDQEAFLRVLLTAPCELTHALLPQMVDRRFGRIINVASLAGLVPGSSGHTLYGATKAFMIKFSQSLLAENARYNVYASALCPGFTYSEFHDVAGVRHVVARLGPSWWSTAEEVATAGYKGVMSGKSIVVKGRRSKQISLLMKFLPYEWAASLTRSRSGSFRTE